MIWEVPAFVEIKMDSEIGAYQDDFKNLPEALTPLAPLAPPSVGGRIKVRDVFHET